MSHKKWVVELQAEERQQLEALIGKRKTAAQTVLKARILLKADAAAEGGGWTDAHIAKALEINEKYVSRTRRKLVEEGLEAVFERKQRTSPPRQKVFDGEKEAKLVALACSQPPEGFARWSIRLLAEKVVEREIVDSVHHNTVGRVLKKRSQAAPA
jgi:hypothetical protein